MHDVIRIPQTGILAFGYLRIPSCWEPLTEPNVGH
jgi:hypothetical protein